LESCGPAVPKGRLTDSARVLPFSRPYGTYALGRGFPALKRRAIVESPSGTTLAEFEPGALLQAGCSYFGHGEEVGQSLGHKVDFCSCLYPLIQNRVKDSLLTIYERS
jgi:hypothetical protein